VTPRVRTSRLACLISTLGALLALSACAAPASSPLRPSAAAQDQPAAEPVALVPPRREPWTFRGTPGVVLITPHYRLFTTERNPILLERLPYALELALERYANALAPLAMPTRPLETYVMATRPQWERLTAAMEPDNASIYLQIRRGGFAANGRSLLFNIGVHDTVALAAHEGWHQFTQSTFRDPLPVYLEEGIATYMEGFRWDPDRPDRPRYLPWSNLERFNQLRTAHNNGRLFSLQELTRTRPQDLLVRVDGAALTWYAQVWALVHFLYEHDAGRHRPAIREMLIDAQSGRMRNRLAERFGVRGARTTLNARLGPGVLLAYVSTDLDALDADYRAFIDRIVAPGSRHAITEGRSPFSD